MFELRNFQMPGLRRIAYLDPADLPPNIRHMAAAGMKPVITSPTSDIEFFGDAELTFSLSKDGKLLTTLTFLSSDYFPHFDMAFIVEDRMGQRRLIGAWEIPFPIVKVDSTTAKAPGQRRQTEYTITWAGYPPEVTVWLDEDNLRPLRSNGS